MVSNLPLNVEVVRGNNVESLHEVTALVVNSKGETIMGFGDTARSIYPRSSIKSIQAINIITSGAAEKFAVTDQELALASASHNGETDHIIGVQQWLGRMGLSEQDLECGAQKQQEGFSPLFNNCSGKHAGMLASALAMGVSTKGYSKVDHPVQANVRKTIEDFCSASVTNDNIAIDGCSIPTYFLPMQSLALGMARFGDYERLPSGYHNACRRIFRAVTEYPYYIAGKDRYCTNMTVELGKRASIKTGAEGVMFASLPDLKLGLVVKANDGAVRAAEACTSWLLFEMGVLSAKGLEKFLPLPLKNWNGIQTGLIRVKSLG
jgi:L-asparaginase II